MDNSFSNKSNFGFEHTEEPSFLLAGVGSFPFALPSKRLLARLIDGLISFGLSTALMIIAILVFGVGSDFIKLIEDPNVNLMQLMETPEYLKASAQMVIPAMIITLICGLALEISLTSIYGGTLGKLICKLRVVSVRDGGRISLQDSFVRWLCMQLPAFLPLGIFSTFIQGAVLASLLFDPRSHQGFQDRMGKTVVVDITGGPLRFSNPIDLDSPLS